VSAAARSVLPQLAGQRFITDGGMETDLIFHDGIDLPDFAAFVLLDHERGRDALTRYYERYLEVARRHGVGVILDTPTWRASLDWGARLGYSPGQLAQIIRRGVALLRDLEARAGGEPAVVVSGCLGPRRDGHDANALMTADEAAEYHEFEVSILAEAGADLVTALTLSYAEEAVGIIRAGASADIPVVISFTVETDGRLASGQPLGAAIQQVDEATAGAAAYFMINCAHPTHFADALAGSPPWMSRVRGIRANASAKSHAEIDESDELDEGDPLELAASYRELTARLPRLSILGGCCGTDHRHIDAICAAQAG
jgi:homocysteine S-methyltransferase